jgi:hypothetical protein
MLLELLGAVGIGAFLGNQLTYWFTAKPLVDKIARLRYDGFRPETPMEPRPKTVPYPSTNES